ncbi:MAG: hypothetical protein ACFE0P_13110 [Oceanicaulis sp.]
MDQVSVEAADALSGEESFILQLRPPMPPGADETALASRIDQFTRLYLAAAGPRMARFAHLAPLTWAIAASRFDAGALETLRGDLCETLFGADDHARAQLARQPGAPDKDNCTNHPSAASRAAFDDESDTFDLDSATLDFDGADVVEVDTWRMPDPRREEAASPNETRTADAEDAWVTPEDDAPDLEAPDDLDVDGDVLSALEELERAFGDATAAGSQAEVAPSAPDEDAFDARRFEADLDAFEAAGARADEGAGAEAAFDFEEAGFDAAEETAGQPTDSEHLTEAPEPRLDLAGELAAFRAEMRAIAGAIPGPGSGEALAQFRDEIEAVAGAMGQRVDGAAQRIEAAADRIVSAAGVDAAGRLTGAAERAEQSAVLMETSVQEAVRALKAVLDAAGPALKRQASGD